MASVFSRRVTEMKRRRWDIGTQDRRSADQTAMDQSPHRLEINPPFARDLIPVGDEADDSFADLYRQSWVWGHTAEVVSADVGEYLDHKVRVKGFPRFYLTST